MSRRSAQVPTSMAKVDRVTHAQRPPESEIRELEKEINQNRDRPLSILLERVVERVRLLSEADGAAIALRDVWGLVCRASAGEAPDVGSRLQPESRLTRECLESGHVVICEDTEKDLRVMPAAKSWPVRSVVAVPVRAQGSVLGIVEVLSFRSSAFSRTQVAELQYIADLLVPILQSEEPTHPEERRRKSAPGRRSVGRRFC